MGERTICPACGRAVGEDDRFCAACGARLGAAHGEGGERKRVSAVVVDLVGFAGISESVDPERTRRLLEEYWQGVRGELERYGGTVEKFIGDAVVGIFGAPVTYEDDAERAVRAALAIRDGAREPGRPAVRVAVATGIALVQVDARPESGEALVVGDVVTLASRLQQHAPRRGVLVDEATHAGTKHVVAYRRLPPLRIRGKREPVAAWRVVGLRRRRAAQPAPTHFVGRRSELALLQALLDRVRSGNGVELVTVVGEPGIGKTRLVRELPTGDADRWEARALPYGEGGAFAPLVELLEEQARIGDADDEATATARVQALLASLPLTEDERRRVEPHVLRLLGLRPAARAGDGQLESFAAWRCVLEAAASTRPLVLVIEDVHWADDALLEFLEHVVEWAGAARLLVLCTARPDLLRRRPAWSGGKANALTFSLGALSDEETAALVSDVLDRASDEQERETLVVRSGGNPLYAEQLARMLSENADDPPAMPDTVHDVIAARLDRLPPGAKQLVRDAAVVGLTFGSGELAALGQCGAELETNLHELERMGLVARHRTGGDEWAFRHRLVREVAYGQSPHAARADKHLGIADWLERSRRPEDAAELAAHHYLRAREEALAAGTARADLDERVRASLVRAAERGLALSAFASAARLSAQALELWPAGRPGRAEHLLRYARALWNAEVSGEAVALEARDGLLIAGNVEGAAEAETLLSEMRWYRGDHAAATAHLAHAVELVAGRPASTAKALVLSRLARSQMLAAEYEHAVATGREALALAEQLGLVELQAEALNSIGSARVRSGDAGGMADVERAIELAAGTRAAVIACNNLGALLLESGQRGRSYEAIERGRTLAEQLGDRLHLEWFEAEDVGRLFDAGRWEEALATANRWLAAPHRTAYAAAGVLAGRGVLLHARGESAAALDDLGESVRVARSASDPQALVPALAEAAFVLVEEGHTDEAYALAEEALELCERLGDMPPLATFGLAVACSACGLRARLLPWLERPRVPGTWLELGRRYATGDLAGALELVEATDDPWIAAYLRLQLAERGGEGLEEALAYYRAVAAERYVRRCEELAGRRGFADAPSASARMPAPAAERKVPA